MAAKLKFGPANSNEGFTPLSTASFSDLRPARIVRELIQNSLDAAVVEAGEDTAIMRFRVDSISRRQLPDVGGYKKAFEKSVKYQTHISGGKLPDAAQQVVNQIKEGINNLKTGEATLLSVMDNGVGLDKKRMNSLLGDGSSAKSGESSGSYGVGHLAPMALSDIRYMLYAGVTEDGTRIVSGRAVLASHPGREKLNAAQGYLIDDFRNGLNGNLYDFSSCHPEVVTNRINQVFSEWGHGSVVMVPVFNDFRSYLSLWEVVSKVAAYNFCAAIQQGKLVIEVEDSTDRRKLDGDTLEGVLAQDKDRTKAARSNSFFEGLRPSGQNAYSILRTLAYPRQQVKVSSGEAYLSLMLPLMIGNTRVDLFRNGMWITDNVFALKRADFANHQPFHAVIEIEAKESGDLHKLIRKAEGPMHDTLSFALLSREERAELRKSLRQLADHIKEQVPEIGTEEYKIDDFLRVPTIADGGGGKRSFSYWGTPTPVSRSRSNQLIPGGGEGKVDPSDEPKPPGPPKPPRPPRPPGPSERRSRPLPFRSVVAPNGEGKLSASIVSQEDFSEAWLVLRVDENTDVTCDRVWQDEDVSIASFSIKPTDGGGAPLRSEIVFGGKTVKVHGLSMNTTYKLDIEYNTPQELARVVETAPVFRLEIHRPPPKTNDREEMQDANVT